MKKLSIISFINLFFILSSKMLVAQIQFLEQRPYEPPNFEQYPSSACVDHQHPYSNGTDDVFLRFDGYEFVNDVIYPDCLSGSSCYDGHAGTDYFMPFNTPILAPADGYVLWASFSPAADPCPGGIEPNGDQGTIIVAHGNNYFTVYLHMTPPLGVEVGESVSTGDTLGFAGNTGCAINTHLHFEVRKGNWFFDSSEPYAVDPFGWWGGTPDPIEEIRGNRSDWLWISNDLIDDGDNGFQRFQGPDWSYLNQGYNNDSWTAPSTHNPSESRHHAMWVPTIETGVEYDIEVFIPSGVDATSGAIYELYVKNENGTSTKTDIIVDQNADPDAFLVIGTAVLDEGESLAIILRDVVTNEAGGSNVVFDALRMTTNTTSEITLGGSRKKTGGNIEIGKTFPNPFNSSIVIDYELKKSASLQLDIHNLAGKRIFNKNIDSAQTGRYSFLWDGKNNLGADCTSGVYFFSITSGDFYQSKKIVYIK